MKNPLAFPLPSRQQLAMVLLLGSGLSEVRGDLITNLTPVADTALRNGTSADTGFGAALALPVGVGSSGTTINHALIKFPIHFIPANATVTQVTLQLASVASNPFSQGAANFSTFRMLKDWNETDTTWNTRLSPSGGWAAPGAQAGGDYANSASASALITPGPSVNFFSSAGLLADVAMWRTASNTNFGWILIANNELAGSGKQIASREDTLQTPVLSISYTVPAPPAAPVILNPAVINTTFQFSFNAIADHAHTVEFTSSLSPTNWITLTNIAPLPADTLIQITNTANASERYFRVGVQ